MKKIAFLLLNCLIFNALTAQDATLTGKLTDAKTGDALPGATVKSGQTGAATDFEGRYSFSLPAGEQTVIFSFTGYESRTEKISLRPGETRSFDLQLTEAENLLTTATVTAGRFEKPLGEVTVSLEVIKPKLLQSTNTTQVDQVLEKVPGVSMIDGQANIRGGAGYSFGAGSRVLLLIDDLPALQADAGLANWADVPVENIAQIEVLKGAASALYGSSAMNGIINIRTGFAKNEPETQAAVFYQFWNDPADERKKWWGKDDSWTRTHNDSFLVNLPFQTGFSFAHRQKMGKLDVAVGTFGLFQNSFERDNYKRYARLTPNFRYRATERLTLGLNMNFNAGRSGDFFLWAGDTSLALQAGLNSQSKSVGRLRYTIDPSAIYSDQFGNRHKLLGRLYSIKNNNDRDQSNQSKTWYGEYQIQRNLEKTGLVITAGVVGYWSGIQAKLYGDTLYTSTNQAGYLQFDQKLARRLNLTAGVRYERFTLKRPEILGTKIIQNGILRETRYDTLVGGKEVEARPVFRVGANYRFGAATYLRASWGQGYRFPTIAEKFITTDFGLASVLPNPKLVSESGWTSEIGLKQGFKISDWRGFLDVTGFVSEYTDMMEFTFGIIFPWFIPSFSSENVGNTQIRGLETVIAGQGKIGEVSTTLLAGYTYIEPKFRGWVADDTLTSSVGYNVLKYRFRHTLKFDAESTWKKISLGLSVLRNSNMEAIDRIFEAAIPGVGHFRREHNQGYEIVDARLGLHFSKKYKLSLLCQNLLNEEYSVRPGALDAPRSFTLRLDGNF